MEDEWSDALILFAMAVPTGLAFALLSIFISEKLPYIVGAFLC